MAIKEDGHNGMGEQAREPLMPRNPSDEEQAGSGSDHSNRNAVPWTVYLSAFVAGCGSFEVGSCVGFSSPTQNAMREELSLSIAQYSVFGSILTVGAMIGAITSGFIADFVGRKGAMRVFSIFCVVGWFIISFAKGALALDMGRLATGYGMGALSYTVPIFIAELAPKNLRGSLTSVTQVMQAGGISFSFISGTVLTWRILALTGLVPCVILFFGLFLVPESPRWLAKMGREKEFETSLQKLRGKATDISYEAAEIKDYLETLERLPKARMLDLFQRRYMPSIILGIGLMVFQQFGGINGVCFYVSDIFESAGLSSTVGTIIYAILQVVVVALCAAIIDRFGRKPLLLVSALGLAIGCIITALSFYLKVHGLALKSVPILALTGILLFIGSFAAGMSPVPWVLVSEIFPINIKGAAGSLTTLVNWFGAWAVSYTFNFLMSWSSYGTFIVYGAINAMAIMFVMILVPETKGRTLEEIQASLILLRETASNLS